MKYDVFISCKSEDYEYARQIYDFLTSPKLNYRVFLADTELRRRGRTFYGKVIDSALESADHLILFTTNEKYVTTEYVENEWRLFLEEQRSGNKSGNIVTILEGILPKSLPISLRHLQSIPFSKYQQVVDFIPLMDKECREEVKTVAKDQYAHIITRTNKIDNATTVVELSRDGFDAFNKRNYAEAVRCWRCAAEQESAISQYNLGTCYYSGRGVSLDYLEAVKWFRKAAEQGYVSAQSFLGTCYYYGNGVDVDYAEAVKWYRKAAEQGDASAIYGLGCCFYSGVGVTQDKDQAIELIKMAANKGDVSAQQYLEEVGIKDR